MDNKDETFTCCICGKKSAGWGNNPWPVKDDGKCCDECNAAEVIPARVKLMKADSST